MPSLTAWDDFRLVSAIAEARSLVGASEILGLNHSTVFRRLGALEKTLGTRLFDRSRSGYSPTSAGEEMIALAGRMAQDIADFERAVAGRDVKPAGELRVTTNDSFAVHLLAPIFASFRRCFPDIRLDVVVAHQELNLSRRDADVAVRATTEPPETLVGRRVSGLVWSWYAPRRWTGDEKAIDLNRMPWIGHGEALGAPRARKWLDANMPTDNLVCRFDTFLGMAEAASEGLGLAFLPCFIGDRNSGLGRTGDVVDLNHALWLLTHGDLRHSARVRAFMDHAGNELVKLRRMLEGH